MKRWRLKRLKSLFYLVALIFNFCVYKYALPLFLDIKSLTHGESCPACYGSNLCKEIEAGHIQLRGLSKWTFHRNLLNERNVFHATWRNRTVMLKNLATTVELAAVDRTIGGFSRRHDEKRPPAAVSIQAAVKQFRKEKHDLQGLSDGELSSITLSWAELRTRKEFGEVDMLRCVEDQKQVDLFTHRALHHPPQKMTIENILTLLLVNQEPFISIMFQPHFPFPRYYGACGRLAVFEYIGPALDTYHQSSWFLRAHFAVQLLELAGRMSRGREGILLYLTDWSANNFAVDAQRRVHLVDLEGIILVNQTLIQTKQAPGWNVYHTADRFGCANCFSYSAADLCTHAKTDHNFHGVCGGLLAPEPYSPGWPGGLLHSVPRDVAVRHPFLASNIQDCWKSAKPGGRENAANLLTEILRSELEDIDISILG